MIRWLAAVVLLAGCGGADAPPPDNSTAPSTPKTSGPKPSGKEAAPAQDGSSPEALAQVLFDDAVRREKENAGKPDAALAAYHDVCVRVPFTAAGKRALKRCVELEADAVKAIDREFAEAKAAADGLAKQGQYASAVSSLKSYSASTTKESLKRRAMSHMERIENDARRAYVEAVRAAKKASYDEADKLLKAASEKSTVEVRGAAERDLALIEKCREVEKAKKTAAAEEEANRAFGEKAAKLLKRCRERAYAEVLKDLDAAIADPALSACRDRLTSDRAAVAAAASFWEAVQKTLKTRLNQEIILQKTDKKTVRGTLKKIHETGTSVRVEPPAVEIPLDQLESDTLLVLGISRDGLPEDAAASYAAAAMWFFLEGRDAISRVELATALEMNADLPLVESAWRSGFFRSAQAK